MSVRISYGGLPIPHGWHLWSAQSRPEPGRWFFEARYHHTGHWKIGLDFRPMDGAFPDFWMPPLMWKYAGEIEMMEKLLSAPLGAWAQKLLHIHPTNHGAFAGHIKEYGEKAKQKKKLLFGSVDKAGMHEHEIPAPDELYNPMPGSMTDPVPAAPGYKYMVKEKLQFHGQTYVPGDMVSEKRAGALMEEFGAGVIEVIENKPMPEKHWFVQGKPWPYDPVLMDTLTEKPEGSPAMGVRVFLDTAFQSLQGWSVRIGVAVGKAPNAGGPAEAVTTYEFQGVGFGPQLPVVKVEGVYILKMDQWEIKLRVQLEIDEQPWACIVSYNADWADVLFPHKFGKLSEEEGVGAGAYWIPNPKWNEASD